MNNDKATDEPSARKKRVPLLSNGLPEVFMPDWIKRSPANMRVEPPATRPDKTSK